LRSRNALKYQPDDRMARLLLLLANVSQFGTGPFNRQIEEIRFFAGLSRNERHIVRQIFLVCFQHAERDGQTIQKIAYQRLIRRLMLNQPSTSRLQRRAKSNNPRDHSSVLEFPSSIRHGAELLLKR
jgi:hypothetical protein